MTTKAKLPSMQRVNELGLGKSVYQKILFLISQPKTQKNRLNETLRRFF